MFGEIDFLVVALVAFFSNSGVVNIVLACLLLYMVIA